MIVANLVYPVKLGKLMIDESSFILSLLKFKYSNFFVCVCLPKNIIVIIDVCFEGSHTLRKTEFVG